jgi:hypothetical protein
METGKSGITAIEPFNDTAKASIKRRIIKAIADEKLYTNEAAILLGISPANLSMMKNPDLWHNLGPEKWEIVRKWTNSGLSIIKFGSQNGRSIVESEKRKEPMLATVKFERPTPIIEPIYESPQPDKSEKQKPTGTAESMANAHKFVKGEPMEFDINPIYPTLLLVFGKAAPITISNKTLDEIINEVKDINSNLYFQPNGGVHIYETKKVYSIENKPVETRF